MLNKWEIGKVSNLTGPLYVENKGREEKRGRDSFTQNERSISTFFRVLEASMYVNAGCQLNLIIEYDNLNN